VSKIEIIQDTREQRPWAFDHNLVDVTVGTLSTADYALNGDDSFGIERKSLNDFVGTISTGWQRFKREIQRMHSWDAKVIIVESNYTDCCYTEHNGKVIPPVHNHYMIEPQFIMKQIAVLTLMNVSVLFAHDAHHASQLAYRIFKERHEALTRKSDGKTQN
jgi:ERCC4-type nuclease